MPIDFCDLPIPPVTAGCAITDGAPNLAGWAAGNVLTAMGDAFAHAAETILNAVFSTITATTTVDLSAAYVTRNFAALASVGLVLVVGLFVMQVVTAAVRREPGGLVRALTGAGIAVLGTAAAAAVTGSLLTAVDALSNGLAGLAGTSIEDAARKLLDVQLLMQLSTAPGGPALMLVFGLLFVLGAALLLGTLLVRKALLVVVVVLAPLAFAGAAARLTSGWVRRWVQVTLALVLSKLAIVVVFVVAVGMVGQADGIGALLAGLILLLLACLAPWACFKILDFAGTHVAAEWHRSTNGATLAVVQQGRASAQSMMRTAALVIGGGSGGATSAAAGAGPGGKGGAAAPPAPRPPAAPVPPAPGPAAAGRGPAAGTPGSAPADRTRR